jgi:predicted dehydrogenase
VTVSNEINTKIMQSNAGLDILVVGTGMYVCGRGTDGFGTVLPAIYEWNKANEIDTLHIAGTNPNSIEVLKHKQSDIEAAFGTQIDTDYYPTEGVDDQAYLQAAERMDDPCCAMVVVPDHLHHEITANLIKRSIPSLVVKPLAPTVAEVDDLVRLQNEHDVIGAVEFHKRFDRSNRMLRDAYTSGELGDPLYFLVQYSQRKLIPEEQFRTWVERTNIFQYLGPHYVDIIRFVTGAKPVFVSVDGQQGYLAARGYDTYDAIEAMVQWEGADGHAFQSCFVVNWIDPNDSSAMSDQHITYVGTKGRFEADQKRRGIQQISDSTGIMEPNPDFCRAYGTLGTPSYGYEGYGIDSFHRYIDDVRRDFEGEALNLGASDRVVTFEEAKVSTAVVEAVNKALKNKLEKTPVEY